MRRKISIHAPRVGCDLGMYVLKLILYGFQSTHPGWGATAVIDIVATPKLFQSTHPGWGATLPPLPDKYKPYDFNPRTPGGVRPAVIVLRVIGRDYFNPRTPGGVRLLVSALSYHYL